MPLFVYSRPDLVEPGLSPERGAVLLEGDWPPETAAATRLSLDAMIDRRFHWIDEEAAKLAESLAGYGGMAPSGNPLQALTPTWLNVLELRYYLVKLIRVVAFFSEVLPVGRVERVGLTAVRQRDDDYASLLEQLCQRSGTAYEVHWVDRPSGGAPRFPSNRLFRRMVAAAARWVDRGFASRGGQPRIVLCGNPRLLEPVCDALLSHGARVWWLYDRFALRSLARWRFRGVPQLVCDASLGQEDRFTVQLPERVDYRGVNLSPAAGVWLANKLAVYGPHQTRLVERIDAHLSRVTPDVLVLDEDATPMKRAAVFLGRLHGASSVVVQHGAPCGRFGFSPLAADRFFAWGQCSRDQLLAWGVEPERVVVTGSPVHDQLRARLAAMPRRKGLAMRPHLLLLATTPPRDDRPDHVGYRLNTQTYAEMLRVAFAAVANRGNARLTVKLHPRSAEDPILDRVLGGFPALAVRRIQRGSLEKALRGVDCVLSLGSSGGVDATLAGIPVIQVLPDGVDDLLPYDRWSLSGTAHTEAQLHALLERALGSGPNKVPEVGPQVFGDFSHPAAERIVQEILALASPVK